jgi:hypothetical protein
MHGLNKTWMKLEIEKALAYLVRQKVLREYIENNTHFFSLTDDEQVLWQALEMVMTEWCRWQSSLKNAQPVSASGNQVCRNGIACLNSNLNMF